MLRLTVLGGSPAWPNPGQAASGYLVETERVRMLVDCGSGVATELRAHDPGPLTDIVISHFHADHWFDLVPLHYAHRYGSWADRPHANLYLPPGGRAVEQVEDALGQLGLELRRLGAVDPALVPDQVPVLDEVVDFGFIHSGGRSEQLSDGGKQQLERHARAPVALGLREDVKYGRARSLGTVVGDAEQAGDPIGGQEADAEHAGQLVRLFGYDAVRAVAVRLAEPWRQVGQAVW